MKIPVQDASAQQYDIEAPDDANLEDIVASASKQIGREVKAVEPVSKTAYTLDKFKGGVAKAAGMLGIPVDALAGIMRKVGVPVGEEPVGGSKQIQKGWELLQGVKGYPAPTTASEWLLGRPAEFAGASALPSSATVAKSAKPVLAGVTELLSSYLGGIGSKAGEEAGGEITKGGAKVVGAGREAQETAEQAGRILGSYGGGLGAGGGTVAMGVPRVAASGTKWLREGLIPKLKDEKEIEKVSKSLFTKHFRESFLSDPRWKSNIAEALKAKSEIPGFEPDLSMAAGTQAVRALQQHAETESPSAAARGVEKREAAVKALKDYRDANFAQGEKSLQELSAQELDAAERALGAQQSKLELDQERLKTKVRSGQFGPEDGNELEKLKKEQYKTAMARADASYTEVYQLADQLGYQGSLDPVVDYIRRYQRDLNRVAQKTPAVVSDLLQASKTAAMQTKKAAILQVFGGEEKLPDGITSAVARHGGLNKIDLGGDLGADISKTPAFAMRGKGYSFYLQHNGPSARNQDYMLTLLKEDGYLPEDASVNDMIGKIDDELRAGEAMHFRDSDWERVAEAKARDTRDFHDQMGTEVGHDSEAKYPSSFGPMHSILKRIRQEQRYYGTKSTDEARLAMKPLNDLEKVISGEIEHAGVEVSSRLAQADNFFKTTVADPFYHGVAAQSFNDRGLIENVARRMLTKGEEGAKNFREVYGQSERADDLLWNGVIDNLAGNLKDRPVTTTAVRTFYESHKKFIDQFPTIRSRLTAVDQVAQGLEDRTISLAEQRKAVNRDLISTLVGRPDPEKYLVSIVQNEQAMKSVAGWAKKNPEMGQQILRSYIDGLWDKPDPARALLENEKTLKPVFDAVNQSMWNKAVTLLTGESIRARGAPDPHFRPEIVTDPMKILTATGTPNLFSRIRMAVYKQISPEYALVDVGGRYFFRIQQDQAREAINAALYDPKLIDNIMALDHQLQMPKPPWEKIKETLEDMKQNYLNHAIRVSVMTTANAQEPPTERKSRESGARALRQQQRVETAP